MAIHTTISGIPAEIRTTATWLRSQLAPAAQAFASQVSSARTTAGSNWDGDASLGFQAVASTLRKSGDDLDLDATSAADALDAFATSLESIQGQISAVRSAAVGAGLELTADEILEPAAPPVLPAQPATDGSAPPQQVAAYRRVVAARTAYFSAATAYSDAEEEMGLIRGFYDDALAALKSIPDASAVRWGLVTATFGATAGSVALSVQTQTLRAQARFLADSAQVAEQRYLTAGSAQERMFYERTRYSAVSEADDWLGRVDDVNAGRMGRLFGGKLPVVGTIVTIAGVGWDVHTGKPVGPAAANAVGATLGSGFAVWGVAALGGPVSLAVAAGVVVGIGVGFGAEWVWTQAVDAGEVDVLAPGEDFFSDATDKVDV